MKLVYVLLLIGNLITIAAIAQESRRPVQTKKGPLVLPNLIDQSPDAAPLQRLQFRNKQYLLVQFNRIPTIEERRELVREGVVLQGYLPGNAFFAEMPAQVAPEILKKYSATGVYGLEPSQKISPKIAEYTGKPDQYIAVTIIGNPDRVAVIRALKEAGAELADTKIQPKNTLFVKASRESVEKIAALPFVSFVGVQTISDRSLNSNNRAVHGLSSLYNPLGRNLQGQGVVVGVGDEGNASAHIDINSHLINRNPIIPTTHGTHVVGTLTGAGIIQPRYRGMAPKATVIGQFFSDILVQTPQYITDYGMALTNNSYNSGEEFCPGNGDYDILSNFVDEQMLDYPQLLHVFAAGNDGAVTCLPYPMGFNNIKSGFQCAKNVLTVGNVSAVNLNIYVTASRGPVDDGRIKPEVVAGGDGVWSTRPNNNYGQNWGSSMSAPTVTGSLALIYERYRQLNGGANPPAALIKAAAVNGADDRGNVGPDFSYGFGIFNARNAIETIENNRYVLNSVAHGGTVNFSITGVPAGADQVKVLLYWPDAPASPSAPTALVNNLDLTVTAPGGAVHNPLVLNPNAANVNDVAVEAVDNRNNIEQVIIYNPPAGDFTVTVNGTNIPSGSQNYVVVYQVINPGIIIEHPTGNEKLVPGETEGIRWNAFGDNTNTFTVEYSINNGSSWTTINNAVPANNRILFWPVPNLPTTQALVRVTRNVIGVSDVSDQNFTILSPPAPTPTNVCPGYINVTWPAVPSATSYDVLLYRGTTLQTVQSTALTNYLITGLSRDSVYYVSVKPYIGGVEGRRSNAQQVTASGGGCTLGVFNDDFSVDSLVTPGTGRQFTSTQLGTQSIGVRIRNVDDVASSGSFNISYQVNGGAVVTESSTQVIPSLSTYVYSFTQTYDFSAVGTYTIKAWVDHGGDLQRANDTLVKVIRQLSNNPITLSPSFTEGFESADTATYTQNTMGLAGLDRADFSSSTTNGRARTFVNTGIARSGNRAITLDQARPTINIINTDSLKTTFNLSGYSSADQLWLDFFYKNHGIDFSLPGNQVWIRGSDLDAWIPVFTLPTNDPLDIGVYRASPSINITETLLNAVPAQSVSSSFQVRFGQTGLTTANSVIPNGNLDDGFTYDDITITNAVNDVGVQALVSPALTNFCGLTTTETIQLRVKNYSDVTLNNVAISYRVNGVTVNEIIPTLTPGQVYVHTFAQTANLAAFQQYTLDAWVHYGADNYRNNDSLLNVVFHTTPTITSYPYLEGFETNNGYWYTGGIVSSWEWGTPGKTIIDRAANGSKAWVTSLADNYNNSEQSYLYSPCFNLSSLTQPVLSFSHIFSTEDDCECDYHWVEYSLDDVNWIKLGTPSAGTNWYDTTHGWHQSIPRWHVASYDVPVTASKVRFRFVMSADPMLSREGVGIDDVHIFEKAAVYTGPDITSGLTQSVSGNNWVHFTVGGTRVASINPEGQDLGNTEVKVFFNNTGLDRHTNIQYYLDRNIVIQPANIPTGNVRVRFYFTDAEINNLINATGCGSCTTIGDAYEAGVTQYSNAIVEENGTLVDNNTGLYHFILPAAVEVVPHDNGYYAEYQVSNFSEFWINGGGLTRDLPLPVSLTSFTVSRKNNTALLEWVTQEESDADKFVIEKSVDGATYQAIGEVKAVGNSTTPQRYEFTDLNLVNGVNYYRLRIVDVNGAGRYSPVRLLNVSGNESIITIYPNPVKKGILYVNTSANCKRVDITDVSGRVMKSVIGQGTRQVIPLYGLAKGTYVVTVITDNKKKSQKIFVE